MAACREAAGAEVSAEAEKRLLLRYHGELDVCYGEEGWGGLQVTGCSGVEGQMCPEGPRARSGTEHNLNKKISCFLQHFWSIAPVNGELRRNTIFL